MNLTNVLHVLPPETAHGVSVWALKNGLGPSAKPDDPALRVILFGKTFSNPIGLAAGAEKKGEALVGWTKMGFGFVEAGTVTLHPRAGNPRPRVWRMPDGKSLVNWMGLPGDGLAPFVDNLKAFSKTEQRKNLVLGASISSPEGNLDDFRALAAGCAPWVDYMTLNASCPNVAHHDAGSNPAQTAAEQIKAVKAEAGAYPLLLKLGPTRDREVLKLMVDAAMSAGAAGIVACNTFPNDKKPLLSGNISGAWPQHDGQPVGGYSGSLALETACWMIAEIRQLVGKDAPVMGLGGIQSGADALRMLKAGANVIQLYTGLVYQGPALLGDIKKTLLQNR